MTPWTSITDDKSSYPSQDQLVLATDGFDYSIGYYVEWLDMWFLDYSATFEVKYWLEIPDIKTEIDHDSS